MFDRIKRLFGSASAPAREIVQCETKALETPAGPKFAIFLAANLHQPAALDALVEALVERFKLHRMISPPETSMLLLTIIGPCDAPAVLSRWQARVSGDQIARLWMDQMEKADLAVTPKGAVASQYHSLLPTKGERANGV
ncbi:hypothetical protein CfE428DRAFT_3407 [Chthoniobacter flavus Ellin428]|uniref:Uncharacterized protein n=1 Tax=Chthoniobacter flavus Ellin428 TaxID=497964 RepID=B4D3B9_9BACT|nr:hypothetical protein [Chthoniobacter flavus]EDY19230.1 hypothetical protein CfE428DRAFT_3407 [Chthoniobacter flavus Ellin428]TCO88073.1 hypothetical protein EV701_119117 [Chthoniobacter flavus]